MAVKSVRIPIEAYVYVKPKLYFYFYVGSRYYFRLMPTPYIYVVPDLKIFANIIN